MNGVAQASTLDHFCLSENICKDIKEAGVFHDGDNLSNHSPIYLKVHLGEINLEYKDPRVDRTVNWAKATLDSRNNFKQTLSSYLNNIRYFYHLVFLVQIFIVKSMLLKLKIMLLLY